MIICACIDIYISHANFEISCNTCICMFVYLLCSEGAYIQLQQPLPNLFLARHHACTAGGAALESGRLLLQCSHQCLRLGSPIGVRPVSCFEDRWMDSERKLADI